ncbi:MAG: DUF4397 domain-containing protein, partial [Chloroflexi bacterium]|nr:DUF4397 domain-containing protein [Chloroflexota bacterium]
RQHRAAFGPTLAQSRGVSRLRAIQSVDGAAVNVLVSGPGGTVTAAGGLGFGQAGGYIDLTPGSYSLTVVDAASGSQLARTDLLLETGREASAVVVGKPGGLSLWLVDDENREVSWGDARLRLLHAAPDGPKLTVRQLFGQDIFIRQSYLSIGDYTELYPQEWDLGIHDEDNGERMLSLESIALDARHSYTWLAAQNAQGELRYFLFTDAAPVSSLRLLNAGSGPLDLKIDGQSVFSGLAPATLNADKAFGLGQRQATLFVGGVAVAQSSLVVTANQDITLAYANGGLRVYTETNQVAEPNFVLARAINLTGGPLAVRVQGETIAEGLAAYAASAYAALRHRPSGVTVEVLRGGTVIAALADVKLGDGTASTLYLLESGGQATALVGLDTAVDVDISDYLRLDGGAVQSGKWQVELTNALAGEEYALRVIGLRPQPALGQTALSQTANDATVEWQYTGTEPTSSIEIRLREVTDPPQGRSLRQSTRAVEVLDSQGFPKSITVTDTTELLPEYGEVIGAAFLYGSGDPSWIDGTPQRHTFALDAIPSGMYEVTIIADDRLQPPVSQILPTRLLVDHPWPDVWSANVVTITGDYQTLILGWDEFPGPDVTDYVLFINTPAVGESFVITEPAHSRAVTITTLSPNAIRFVNVAAYDSRRERYSYSVWSSGTPAGAFFEMAAVNPPAALTPGQPVSFDLRLTSQLNPYPTAVTLAAASDNPAQVQLRFAPDVLQPTPGGALAKVTVTPNGVLAGGPISFTVRAYGGGEERQVTIHAQVQAADFDLALSVPSVDVGLAGGEVMLHSTGVYGHNRLIQLDALNLPAGLEATVTPPQISPGQSATLRLRQTAQAQRGSYTVTLLGDDGPNDERHSLTVTVRQPDFTVQPESSHLLIDDSRSSARFRLEVGLADGWQHPVRLWVQAGEAPPASNVSLSREAVGGSALAATLDGAGFAYLTVTPGAGTPLGVHLLTVYAESAGVGKQVELIVDVQAAPSAPPVRRVFLPLMQKSEPPAPLTGPDLIITSLQATPESIWLVIRNQGQTAVTNEFWVDVYIDPQTPPSAPNQLWSALSAQGLVWGVHASALPLLPGQELRLSYGDAFYAAAYSEFSGGLAVGTSVYAQVDSWDKRTDYGAVLEEHERWGGLYNNVAQSVVQSPAQATEQPSIPQNEFREEGLPERLKPDASSLWLPAVRR